MVVFFQMDKSTMGSSASSSSGRATASTHPHSAASGGAASRFWQPGRDLRDPRTSGERVASGAEALWLRDNAVVSTIFRDTTLQAFEGCLFGPATGYCGLAGQLLVRISPADSIAEPDPCSLEPRRG